MTDFQKLMVVVGVLCLVVGVFSFVGGSPTPGAFFVLSGLIALGGIMAGRMGLIEEMQGDVDKMVGTAGFGAAGGIGLAWLGMAAYAFNTSSIGATEGHPDLHFWWRVIGALLSIAALGALIGGFLHFRQERA